MRYDTEQITESGFDEATTGFIDIQFGLIAVLILALSMATVGLLNTARRLQLTESSADAFIHLLLYEPLDERETIASEAERLRQVNFFGDHALALYTVPAEKVVVLGPVEQDSGELFGFGNSLISSDGGQDIFESLRRRSSAFFPCFSPLDRSPRFNDDQQRAHFSALVDRCEEVYLPEGARVLELTGDAPPSPAEQPGLDLFIIEGHSDGGRPIGNDGARVAEERAQRVLLALLSEDPVESINLVPKGSLPYKIDSMTSLLPAQISHGYRSVLLDLVPLSARVLQECLVEYDRNNNATQTTWCEALVSDSRKQAVADASIGDRSELRIPRIFAMSSFARYSLRWGTLGTPDNRDRRVEFRFRPAAIPASIHKLVRSTGGKESYYRLYSASAALALHKCDLKRAADETCVGVLDQLVHSDDTRL